MKESDLMKNRKQTKHYVRLVPKLIIKVIKEQTFFTENVCLKSDRITKWQKEHYSQQQTAEIQTMVYSCSKPN